MKQKHIPQSISLRVNQELRDMINKVGQDNGILLEGQDFQDVFKSYGYIVKLMAQKSIAYDEIKRRDYSQ